MIVIYPAQQTVRRKDVTSAQVTVLVAFQDTRIRAVNTVSFYAYMLFINFLKKMIFNALLINEDIKNRQNKLAIPAL